MKTLGWLRAVALVGLIALSAFFAAACDDKEAAAPVVTPTVAVVPTAEPVEPLATPEPIATAAPVDGQPSADCDVSALEVRRANTERQAIALTFDAGSDAGYTEQILQTLREKNVKAAFGLTGQWTSEHPDLVRAMAADGHILINHTQDQLSFTGLSSGTGPLPQSERFDQLQQAEAIIKSIVGVSTRPYFRPPFGDVDGSVLCDAYAAGYRYVILWTVDTLGWNHATVDEIVSTSLSKVRPGAIYIMHVGSQSQDGPALPQVIDGLRAAGYDIVPLNTLLP
jgi:peptidoglycan/xylan/chitin deacetylase (PgdA/CDA1 family)